MLGRYALISYSICNNSGCLKCVLNLAAFLNTDYLIATFGAFLINKAVLYIIHCTNYFIVIINAKEWKVTFFKKEKCHFKLTTQINF